MSEGKTRRQTINFFGFLRGQLNGLQGIPTLCYELIQNADDVKDKNDLPGGATRISFDICDDALWVENDGVFREIDFNRMEQISWGNKREEAETTGSFGIGFISVYQITDSPELISSGEHWQFRPQASENERIVVERIETEFTRFRLPWAFDTSSIRQELGILPVNPEELNEFATQFVQSIENAALFLKQVRELEVLRNGQLLRRIEVLKEGNELLLSDGERDIKWQIIEGDFDGPAEIMRQKYGALIEEKRTSIVRLAIPDQPINDGLLYAFLPSETRTGMPFHINADFYPSPDRKRILFDQDYKSEWNRLAIECAATTLASNLDQVLDIFDPQGFWDFSDLVKNASESKLLEAPTDKFWDELVAQIRGKKCVLTSSDKLEFPGEVSYLDRDDEVAAASILEELDIPTIHSQLRKYRNPLIEAGVYLIDINTVGQAFHKMSLTERTILDDLPSTLRDESGWLTLWKAINSLWDRAAQSSKEPTKSLLVQSAIAFGSDGALWPPGELFTADNQTRELFSNLSNIVWFDPKDGEGEIPSSLVKQFGIEDGINVIENIQDSFPELWKKGLFSPQKIYEWMENRRNIITARSYLRDRIRSLKIWPTADGKLASLEKLYLAGNFEDPLNLAQLVDVEALGGGQEFLERTLNVRKLHFITYANDWVPRILNKEALPPKKKIHLLEVLAINLGKMRGNQDLKKLLGDLPIVWCGDESFFPANGTYFDTPATREVLGDKTRIAQIPKKQGKAIKPLYDWLGVVDEPRIEDILARIRELTDQSPTRSSFKSIQTIYRYLASHWDQWDAMTKVRIRPLKEIAWLPGSNSNENWYLPTEVYVIFQDYLFKSQGNFLRIDRKIQEISRNFYRYLGINRAPNTDQVVRHLLYCANKDEPVKNEVYTHLTQNYDHPSISTLQGERCLLLRSDSGEEKYYYSEHVFWDQHPFGSYRFRLGPEFGQYKDLFDRLGVRVEPAAEDAIQVLIEISNSKFANSNIPITNGKDVGQIVISSWKLLSEALENKKISKRKIKKALKDLKTIPNSDEILYPPEWLYIEDRPGWGVKFSLLENNLIEKTEGTWPAMEAAGVQRLSKAIKTELHQCENSRIDLELQNRLIERKNLILRVIENHRHKGIREFSLEPLDELSFSQADEIEIIRSFQGFGKNEQGLEIVDAVHLNGTLYFSRNGSMPWIGIARELSFVLHDSGELTSLGMELKEILSADSSEQASDNLDEFGYPIVQRVSEKEIGGKTLEGIGGAESEDDGGDTGPEVYPDDPPKDEPPEHPPSGGGGDGGKPGGRTPIRKPSRLISYVYPEGETSDGEQNPEIARRRKERGQKGVDYVLEFERKQGRDPTDMETIQVNYEGFDVKSVDLKNPTDVRYIEVKSTSGLWDSENPAQVHLRQFETAQEYGESYWLYVVEKVEDDDRKVYCIQNPANRVDTFMFDHGWRPLAEVENDIPNPSSSS